MKKSIQIFIPVVLAILIGSLTFIFAQSREDMQPSGAPPPKGEYFGPPPAPAGIDPRTFEALGLSDLQKEQVRAIEFNARDLVREQENKFRRADEQLRMMIESDRFTDDSAQPLIKAKTDAMFQLELVRLRKDAVIMKILTAEQKALLAQFRKQRRLFPPGGGFVSDAQ